jgi:signal transduction histidine kinase
VKLGVVILLAVVAAFVVNEVGINAGYSRNTRIAVAVLLALVMVQLLARGMTRPLREMAAAAQTIAKGRYGLRVTATSRDEVGELARAFNAMAADLGEVDRQRRELVANVSHELRTPITALRAVLENVVDGVSEPDPVTLGTALAQAERLGRLVAQLLDLSRLESGARLIERDEVELGPLCEQALREAVLARDGVAARCEVPGGLSVRADADLLAQVLANLLDNAVRHSPEDGVVVLSARPEGSGVRLLVADQGPGIREEDRARVFERFSRLDAGRAADQGGAGLGLAITKEIVELHGGSVRVEDGVGCRIAVDLPGRIPMTSPPASGGTSAEDSPSGGSGLSETSASGGLLEVPGVPPGPEVPGVPPGPDGPPAGRSAPAAPAVPAVPAAPAVREAVKARGTAEGGEEAEDREPVSAGAVRTPSHPPARPGAPALRSLPGYPGAVPVAVRNWPGAIAGVLLGGFLGVLAGLLLGFGLGALSPSLGILVGVGTPLIAGFVGTVIGATTVSDGLWTGYQPVSGPLPAGAGRAPQRPAEKTGGGPSGVAAGGGSAGVTAGVAAGGGSAGVTAGVTAGGGSSGAAGGGSTAVTAGPVRGAAGERAVAPAGRAAAGPPGGYVAPPVFPRPELPETPRWLLAVCAAVGLLAAVALPYSSVGLGLVLVAVAMGAAVLPAARKRITPWSAAMGLVAYGMISVALFRDADWLVGLLLLAGFGMAALALSGAGHGWLGVARGGASVVLALLPVPWFLAAPMRRMANRKVLPTLIGLGLTAVLLVVFGALFASADAVFARTVERLLFSQDWAETLPLRVLVFAVFAAVVAAAVLVGLRPVAEPQAPSLRLRVGRGLWVTPLAALNLLFGAFVAMQLTALFGDAGWVVATTDLTYAEYARSGFFQLVVVSVFVLAIVAVASGAVETEGRERWLMAGLLGLLCALTMVILASAMYRLDLYVDAYGLTRLRASVQAAIWWLGGVFVLVLVAGALRLLRRGPAGWLPRTMVLMTGAGLLAFAVWNPDLRVAETQLAVRGVERLDQRYLGGLGAEAVPALDRLPEPLRSCVLREVTRANRLDRPDPWNGWNLARDRAREVLAARPVPPGPVLCLDGYSSSRLIPDQD